MKGEVNRSSLIARRKGKTSGGINDTTREAFVSVDPVGSPDLTSSFPAGRQFAGTAGRVDSESDSRTAPEEESFFWDLDLSWFAGIVGGMSKIGLKEIAFIGYPVTDFVVARRFYGEILGLRETGSFEQAGKTDWVEYDLVGQTLALATASEQWKPDPNGGGVALEVENLDEAVAYLKTQGVRFVMDVQEFPYCRLTLIADPDGNTLALHQRKENHPEHS